MHDGILIIKTGSTLPALRQQGDFEDWIRAAIAPISAWVVDVEKGQPLPAVEEPSAVIVTGSPAMVSQRLPWSEQTAAWLAEAVAAATPILGICYGHQLLAHALGGRAGPNPNGREIGTVRVELNAAQARRDPLFEELPADFAAHVTHEESALKLPDSAVRLAYNGHEQNHAFRVGSSAWGVQFHPEFNAAITRGYIFHKRHDLYRERLAALDILRSVTETPHATRLLSRFAHMFVSP
ncbi:GMP synthase [Halorhodospira halochloris]|uniref:GMP synthase n=1 Tax=Halorhodospira halochloris TaxID=1052 RepID=A0A110B550_HALHR|nr:glutamine amidotransferase [Halorhodospira halochloris]MBK1652343.1 hypothetical protein [Halorhodospira halochloris]BAU57747.1 GMP synthase [Halorhodospira halochloris]